MAIGVWSMDEDGNFELQAPYNEMLIECKFRATDSWRQAVYEYLEERSPYTIKQLDDELLRRVQEKGLTAMEIVDEFIIEALSGDLLPSGDEQFYEE